LSKECPDWDSVADMVDASREPLFRYAVSLCRSLDRADDLVQETFLRALRHAVTLESMNRFQRDAWLKRVLRNRFFDEERTRKRARAAVTEMIRGADRPTDTARLIGLDDLLDRVDERHRDVLEMRFRFSMTSREIGERLGIPAATVRSRLSAAVRALREITGETPERQGV